MIRHYKKFKVKKKPEAVRYFPDGNRNHENQEWGVEIVVCRVSENLAESLGILTLTDLIRFRRVINRGIRILQKHGSKYGRYMPIVQRY